MRECSTRSNYPAYDLRGGCPLRLLTGSHRAALTAKRRSFPVFDFLTQNMVKIAQLDAKAIYLFKFRRNSFTFFAV